MYFLFFKSNVVTFLTFNKGGILCVKDLFF